MGQRGPLPRPGSSESLRRRNTLYKRRGARQAAPPTAVPPPAAIQANAGALDFWHAHADDLVATGRLRPQFSEAFSLLCEMAAEAQTLTAMIERDGLIVRHARGSRPHPACRILRDVRRDFVTLAREFGMTPASDARFPQDDPGDDVDQDEEDLRAFTG